MSTGHRITKALGSAACALFVGGMLCLGTNGLPSLSSSIQVSDQAEGQGLFLSEGMREPMPSMADGNDCVVCRSAPGPVAQPAGDKTKAVSPSSAWYAHWHKPFDRFSRPRVSFAQVTTPVRIAFCRWLK